jgi:hypothetical protein
VNVGEPLNTKEDEVFPDLENGYLYFASDGHAGIGGLDIFKVQIKKDSINEIENVGYPLNSSFDDFGITFDSTGIHGYLTSNRKRGGYDDDIYEFDMDMQTYPFTIKGVMQYKDFVWSEESEILPEAKLYLIDRENSNRVFETITDDNGNFLINVPYFSKYYIEVVDKSDNKYKASLEIQKYRVENNVYQIVVVKDIFDQNVQTK